MKNKFNFLQVANWIFICIQNLDKLNKNSKNMSKDEFRIRLLEEKRKIVIIKEVLLRKRNLFGISNEFIKNLPDIKKQYGIQE